MRTLALVLLASLCLGLRAAAFDSTTRKVAHFHHIVIIVQENRTPDNLFGSNPRFEPGVDIARFGQTSTGATVPLLPAPLASCWDARHSHRAFRKAYNGGDMNGFDLEGIFQTSSCILPGGPPQYKYVDNSTETVQPYFDIARSYGEPHVPDERRAKLSGPSIHYWRDVDSDA